MAIADYYGFKIRELRAEVKKLKEDNEMLGGLLALKESQVEPLYQLYLKNGNKNIDVTTPQLIAWAAKHLQQMFNTGLLQANTTKLKRRDM